MAAFIPLFTMQGVEGQIFSPMARTYAYALVGALLATFTVTPCLASLLLPEHVSEVETIVVRGIVGSIRRCCVGRCITGRSTIAIGMVFLLFSLFLGSRLGSEFLPTLEEGNLWITRDHAADDFGWKPACPSSTKSGKFCFVIPKS